MQLTAPQHIFASVPRTRSPSGRGGYQTLFYTRAGLTEADARAIEERALYYPATGSPTKWQCFRLPSGRIAIARMSAVADLDEFGRGGNYLAQSLALTEAQWSELDYGPFGVLRVAPFYSSLDQALAQGDMRTGDIPPIAFPLPEPWIDDALRLAQQWRPDQLLGLVSLARQARLPAGPDQRMAIVGDERQIRETIAVALLLARPDDRAGCAFDTYAHGCNWGREIDFWGQGFAERSAAHSPYVVDAAQRQVAAGAPAAPRSSLYDRWVEHMIRSGGLDRFFAEQDWALALEALAAGEPWHTPLEQIPEVFVRMFAEINHDLLERSFDTRRPGRLFLALWRALAAEHAANQDLDRLGEIVGALPAEQQLELAEWLSSRRQPAPALQAALDQAIGSSGSPWKRLRRRIFSRSSQRPSEKLLNHQDRKTRRR